MYDAPPPPQTALRPPSQVMRLRRMGAAFPTRLSFLPTLLRHMAAEKVTIQRPVWAMDADGFGHALYILRLGGHPYSLIAVSTDLPADQRTDRVIATVWDTSYVLYDGIPDGPELARMIATAPLQETARFTERDLILSRANKSVRLFDHVTARLRQGAQPDPALIRDTGYLMRTTAVYGNGKFGIADRDVIADRPGLRGPFMAEMLTVWLIRGGTHDLAEHVGQGLLPGATKHVLGIGNATGLGMAPFLVSHPLLLDAWMQVQADRTGRPAHRHAALQAGVFRGVPVRPEIRTLDPDHAGAGAPACGRLRPDAASGAGRRTTMKRTPMKRSAGELQAMVLKAALGAGLPLGHAEDLAVAAGYLARVDPGGLAELQVVLRPPHHVPRDFGPVLAVTSVAAAGPGLIDRVRAGQPPVALHQIDGPRLLAALVACANHRAPLTLHLRQDGRVVVLEPGPKAILPMPIRGQPDIDPVLWDFLSGLAARTTVPSTAASRQSGAGAGLLDLD